MVLLYKTSTLNFNVFGCLVFFLFGAVTYTIIVPVILGCRKFNTCAHQHMGMPLMLTSENINSEATYQTKNIGLLLFVTLFISYCYDI